MKKTYYLLLFVLLASVSAKAQTGWATTNLDQKVSIKFPTEPQKMTAGTIDIYSCKGKDSVGYTANVIDLKVVANLDSATLAPMKDTQEFADQFRTGMASKMTSYTLSDVVVGKWKTFTTYSITATENTTKKVVYTRVTLIGTKLYSLAFMVPANITSANKDVFFGSLEMK